MPSNHALLSPSASHRWLNCSAAPLLEQAVPDETTSFAEEGTLAHAICEAKLMSLRDPKGFPTPEDAFEYQNGGSWRESPLYKPDMEVSSEIYLDHVAALLNKARETTPDAELYIETPLDLTRWIPEGFGTSDAIVVADGTMNVIDYKNGKGVEVSAERNSQMMIYALGAYEQLSYLYNIKEVTMTIIQPRINNYSTYTMTIGELLKWAKNELAPKAKLAFLGAHEEVEVDQHPGDWCRFCKVKAMCRALANQSLVTASDTIREKLLTNDEISEILPKLPRIKAWCSELESYALSQALDHNPIPGYKVVEGRSNRVITDPEALAKKLLEEEGLAPEAIYKPLELKTLTTLEGLVGKKKFKEIAEGLVHKPEGKPTLVPESDKRPELNSTDSDFSHVINNV